MELVSHYEMRKRRKWAQEAKRLLDEARPRLLQEIKEDRYRMGKEGPVWSYCLLRSDLSKARDAVARAVADRAPNWSPAARARRGW